VVASRRAFDVCIQKYALGSIAGSLNKECEYRSCDRLVLRQIPGSRDEDQLNSVVARYI